MFFFYYYSNELVEYNSVEHFEFLMVKVHLSLRQIIYDICIKKNTGLISMMIRVPGKKQFNKEKESPSCWRQKKNKNKMGIRHREEIKIKKINKCHIYLSHGKIALPHFLLPSLFLFLFCIFFLSALFSLSVSIFLSLTNPSSYLFFNPPIDFKLSHFSRSLSLSF